MAVPKRRKSKASRDQRRSHHFKEPLKTVVCVKCGTAILPHTACPNCGFYKGREVIDVMKKIKKREKKAKQQQN